MINNPWAGEKFNAFIQMIEQPTVIIFDEFEKVYDHHEQQKLLTLLDGVYPSKKLFIITCNDKWRVNEHMRNRPGRIYYRLEYKGLDIDFISEYCEDNLKNKSYIESVCRLSAIFAEFNFDMLKALVEEMNRYDETPQEAMKMLNAKPELSEGSSYNLSLSVNGTSIEDSRLEETTWHGNPLAAGVVVDFLPDDTKSRDDDDAWKSVVFTTNDLRSIDAESGKFHFVNSAGAKLSLSKIKVQQFNYSGLY